MTYSSVTKAAGQITNVLPNLSTVTLTSMNPYLWAKTETNNNDNLMQNNNNKRKNTPSSTCTTTTVATAAAVAGSGAGPRTIPTTTKVRTTSRSVPLK